MHGLFFYIGLGIGLAAACGLRPFLPVLLAGALASAKTLGVSFAHGHFYFLKADWWLLAVVIVLALAYALQLRMGLSPTVDPGSDKRAPDPLASALTGLGLGAGALMFAGTLAAHEKTWWPGLIGGIVAAALAQRVAAPVIAGARKRLPDKASREALTVYLDAAALLLAVLVALLHPLGYIALAALGWFLWRQRTRSGEKYAGLRILRR